MKLEEIGLDNLLGEYPLDIIDRHNEFFRGYAQIFNPYWDEITTDPSDQLQSQRTFASFITWQG